MNNLILENVTIGYNKPLVKNIQLELNPGRLVSVFGDNGSGKSTLMKTLLKLIDPLEGNILLDERNIKEFRQTEWSDVFAAVFSRISVTPEIRVKELIGIGVKKKDLVHQNLVVEWLAIEHLMNKYANQISDGQLQKIMIARALNQNTPFIFFDEPTAHLDYKNKARVFELLKNLVSRSGKSFIIITHEILQAMYLSDEIWLIQNGQLFSGSPEEMKEKFNLEKEVLNLTKYVRS